MTNGEWIIKNGYTFSDIQFVPDIANHIYTVHVCDREVGTFDADPRPCETTTPVSFFKCWLDEEYKEKPLLTKEEIDWLRNFLSCQKGELRGLQVHIGYNGVYLFGDIILDNEQDSDFDTSYFKNGWFSNLKDETYYTAEELGL